MSVENRVRRLELIGAVNEIHKSELMTLIGWILSNPGEATAKQIAASFDHLTTKQHIESCEAIDYVNAKYPVDDDHQQTIADLNEMGFKIAPREKQEEFDFDQFDPPTEGDLDLFGDDDDIPF